MVSWIGPEPPPGSSPHVYTFLLYEQPKDFEGNFGFPADGKLGLFGRMRWDLKAWEAKAGVGEAVAVGCFRSH
jgi:phosphatidylethanolamine-binding protein